MDQCGLFQRAHFGFHDDNQPDYSPLYDDHYKLRSSGAYAWQPNDGTSSNDQWVSGSQPSSQPYVGSFQSFLNSMYWQNGVQHHFYEDSLAQLRGTWGVDTSTDTVWAVLDVGNGVFAVVPEPGTIYLLAGGLLSMAGFWWRRRARGHKA